MSGVAVVTTNNLKTSSFHKSLPKQNFCKYALSYRVFYNLPGSMNNCGIKKYSENN